MNCENVKENLADLIGDTISQSGKDEIVLHLLKCPECAQEFGRMKQVASGLSPRYKIQASPHLKSVIMNHLENNEELSSPGKGKIRSFLNNRMVRLTGVAAALLIAFVLITLFRPQALNSEANAARVLLDKSFAAFGEVKTLFMQFKVRSVPGDNLDLIETRGDFIDYRLWKVFTPIEKWKIEKPGLTVVMDGTHQYKYMEKSGIGYSSGPRTGFVDWLKILLDPRQIIDKEKDNADKQKSEYTIDKNATETVLTVKSKALGDFGNTFRLNTSIEESNNRRVYRFDKATDRLKAVEIYINDKGNEIKVLEVSSIEYDVTVPPSTFVITLPQGTKWVEVADLEPKPGNASTYKSGEDLARAFFEALASEDWNTVFELCPYLENSARIDEIKDYYGGVKLLKIGKSFKSGLYPGVFIPYEIRLRSGEILKHNLSVRNDNKAKAWTIDGGF